MSYESTAEPIRIGYLFDFLLPEGYPQEMRDDLTRPFELVFNDGLHQRVIDRPVRIVYREVEGLPKGTVKAVIDAYNAKSGVPAPPAAPPAAPTPAPKAPGVK